MLNILKTKNIVHFNMLNKLLNYRIIIISEISQILLTISASQKYTLLRTIINYHCMKIFDILASLLDSIYKSYIDLTE